MTNIPGQLALVIGALVAVFFAWRPRALSVRIGEVSSSGVVSRPLAFTGAAFLVASGVWPGDPQSRLNGITGAVWAIQLTWIVFRSNPDSWPIVGSRSRAVRVGTFAFLTLAGAAAGAALGVAVGDANLRGHPGPRLSDFARIGALFGPGAALAIWERRANSRLLAQQRTTEE
jgi:hypothetical protein